MGSNERMIVIGVLVALTLLAGYKYHAPEFAPVETLAQVQIQGSR